MSGASGSSGGKQVGGVDRSVLAFGATIFLGAFLLFQVQPLIGKYILPWFGGTPAVLDDVHVVVPGLSAGRLRYTPIGWPAG